MKASKHALNTLIAGAVAVTMASAANKAQAQSGKEKCYGVVKAGKNMCGRADGGHSCAAQAAKDGDPQEWLYLPAGVCEKLVGGSLTSGKGGAHSCNKSSCNKSSCNKSSCNKSSCSKQSCNKSSCGKQGCNH